MSVFMIAAMSADGLIAPSKGVNESSTSWTSKADTEMFKQRTKEAGVVVMGRTTYMTIGRPLQGRLNVVYSNEVIEGVEITTMEPVNLISDLRSRGYDDIAIIGGASIYSQFIKAGVIDKIYLTVEPILFGQGVPMFDSPLDVRLRLLASHRIGDDSLFLEYEVIRSH